MALIAVHREMNSFECEIAMEVTCDLPAFLDMTVRATITKFTSMNIFVAAITFTRHRFIANRCNCSFSFFDGMAWDRLVAFGTFDLNVLVSKFKLTLLVVIEVCGRPFHFGMALGAGFS